MSGAVLRRHARDRGMLVGLGLAVLGLLWLLVGFASFPGGEGWGYDYQSYADAALRIDETGSPYQPETLGGPYRPGPYGLYMYAPPLAVAVAPLAGADLDTGTALWFLLHVAMLIGACTLMPVRPAVRLATFGVAALSLAVTRDLVLGNVSVLLLLLMALAWRWLDRPAGSVAQALAMSIRPTLGVLLLWQALRRKWGAVAWTLGAGVVLILLTLPVVGPGGYSDYITVLRNLSHVSGVESNYDLSSTAGLLGASEAAASLALLAGYAIAIAAIVLSVKRDREVGFIVTVAASLLLSPLLWDHYLAMLVLPAAFLAERGRAWALALPLLTWLPMLVESATFIFPLLAILGTVLPFLARAPRLSSDAAPAGLATTPAGSAPVSPA